MRRIIGRVPRAGLLCALVAFLAGTAWSLVTPPFEVPDETAHFPYVQALAETGNPPDVQGGPAYSDEVARTLEAIKFDAVVGRPGDRGVWSDREQARLAAIQGQTLRRDNGTGYSNASSQPPGYYALGAVVYWASPSQDVLTRLWLLRMLGALLAAGTTLAAFLFLREVLPGTPLAWTTGGLAVALQPVFGFTSAGVNSDALLFLASALMFLAVARAFRRGLDVRSGAFIGAATALGIMTKLNFLAFVPGVSLALLVLLWRARRGTAGDGGRIALRGTLAAAAIVAVPALVYIGLNTLVWHRSWWAQSLQAQVTETSNGNGSVSGIPIRQQLGYVWQLYLPRLPFMLDQFPYFPPYETWWKRTFGVFGWVDYGFRPWVYQVGLALFAVVCAAAAAGARGPC